MQAVYDPAAHPKLPLCTKLTHSAGCSTEPSISVHSLQVHAAMSTLLNLCLVGSRANTPAVLEALVSGLGASSLAARCRCAEVRFCCTLRCDHCSNPHGAMLSA